MQCKAHFFLHFFFAGIPHGALCPSPPTWTPLDVHLQMLDSWEVMGHKQVRGHGRNQLAACCAVFCFGNVANHHGGTGCLMPGKGRSLGGDGELGGRPDGGRGEPAGQHQDNAGERFILECSRPYTSTILRILFARDSDCLLWGCLCLINC